MKKTFILFLSFILILTIPLTVFGAVSDYTWSTLDLTKEVSSEIVSAADNSNPLNLDCGACILMEQKTGQILYSYNAHESLLPASVTKLMSIYLIMEAISQGKINLDTQIPCSENASSMGGSQIWLDTRETLSVNEMLKAICIVSANDYKVQLRHKKF